MKRIVSSDTDMGAELDVLRCLEEKPRQSPRMIRKALKEKGLTYSLSQVKSVLSYHKGMNQVNAVARGIYEITELGLYALHHPLNVKED